MSSADVFMRYLFIVGPIVAALVLIMRRAGRAHPDTAFCGFDSADEFGSYYSFARRTIRRHMWLFWLPLVLVLSIYAFRIPMWISVRRDFMMFLGQHHMGDLSHALPQGLGFSEIVNLFGRIPGRLNLANSDSMVNSLLIILVFLVAVGIRNKFVAEIRHYAGAKEEDMGSLNRILWHGRLVLGSVLVLLILAAVLRIDGAARVLVVVTGLVLTVGALFVASLWEGFILFYLKDVVEAREPGREPALKSALEILPSLFVVNLMVAFTVHLHAMIAFPKGFPYLMGEWLSGAYLGVPTVGFARTIMYMTYIGSCVGLFTVYAGFPLIVKKSSPWEAWRSNFRFIGKYFLRYFGLVGSGVLLLFIPPFLALLLSRLIHPMSYPGLVVAILISILTVWFGVHFLLASFKFFMDHKDAVTRGR